MKLRERRTLVDVVTTGTSMDFLDFITRRVEAGFRNVTVFFGSSTFSLTFATSAISIKLELLYIERVFLHSVFGMVNSIFTFFGSFSGFFGESSISLRLTDARGLTTLVFIGL